MISDVHLPDRAPDREPRVTVAVPHGSLAALDELARHHGRDLRSEAVHILVAAIAHDLALLHVVTDPPKDGVPRSVASRRRAAAGAELEGRAGARGPGR